MNYSNGLEITYMIKKNYVVINGANQTFAMLRLKVRQESIRGFLVFLIIILMIW